jgi:hypothetical protein
MDKTEALLGDIRGYLKIMAAIALRPMAGRVLDTYEKALLFSKLDGNTPQLKLQELTKVPQPTISIWMGKFMEAGIVCPPNDIYRNYRAMFTLQELGISIATLRKRGGSEGVTEPGAVQETSPEAA